MEKKTNPEFTPFLAKLKAFIDENREEMDAHCVLMAIAHEDCENYITYVQGRGLELAALFTDAFLQDERLERVILGAIKIAANPTVREMMDKAKQEA